MGSTTDFLFQGKPPPSVNKYGTTTNSVPQWLSDYVQGTLNRANTLAAQPYQPYTGPRIAAPNADMKAGWDQARTAATSYQPYFQSATATLGASGAGGAGAAAQPYINKAAGMSATGAASGALNQAQGMSATGAANPYLTAAGQSSTGLVNGYMSPYMTGVVDQIGRKGQETLQSNLHTLGDDFIKAGGLGGTRHMDAAGRAATTMTQAVTDAQGNALNTGYQTALGAAQNDLARQAQVGQTMGNLTLGEQQNMTQIGNTKGNLTLGEQQNQANIGQMAGNFSSIDTKNMQDQSAAYAALGRGYQTAGLTGAAATESVGNTERGIDQSNLDLAYQDFNDQKNHPYNMVDWMRGQTVGMPNMGGTAYETNTGPLPGATYGTSDLGQLVGGLTLADNVGKIFKAEGGYINLQDVARDLGGYTTARGKPTGPRVRRVTPGTPAYKQAAAGYTSARAAQ